MIARSRASSSHGTKSRGLKMAPKGHGAMSALSPLLGVKRKSDFRAVKSAFDPTATSAVRSGTGFGAGLAPIR